MTRDAIVQQAKAMLTDLLDPNPPTLEAEGEETVEVDAEAGAASQS
jgi:hypothetical protein